MSTDRIVLHVETPGGDEETRGFVWMGDPITLGRHEDRDLRLHGHHASRHHASIVRNGTGWLIADQSANGTTLNGSPIAKATPTALDDGDRLVIAGTVLRVEIPGDGPPHTVLLRSPSSGTEPVTARADGSHPGASLATPPPPIGPALEIMRDGRVVREVPLTEGCSLTLGRDPACDVVVPDPTQLVSSLHAQVDWNWSGLVVLDHSTNGLYLDGVRVDVCEPLADGQVMSFATDASDPGAVTVRVRRPGSSTGDGATDGAGADLGHVAEQEIESLLETVDEDPAPPSGGPSGPDDPEPRAPTERPALRLIPTVPGRGVIGLAVGAILASTAVLLALVVLSLG